MGLLKFVRENGLYSTFEEVKNRLKIWDLDQDDFLNVGTGSSFSDNREYLSIVEIATQNDEVFNKFRSNRQYRKILEHVTKSLASEYLKLIPDSDRNLLAKLTQCDIVGGPLRYKFKNLGRYSPTTIRYLYFHTQYQKHFGELEKFRVVEIGGGFGGQAAVSLTLNPHASWTIFDLPEVLALQDKYLRSAAPGTEESFKSGLELSRTEGDLLLSNYALSEISRELQIKYFDLVVSNCPRGYMAWNTISEKENGGLSLSEVLKLIPGSRFVAEYPLSSPGNVFVYWGN